MAADICAVEIAMAIEKDSRCALRALSHYTVIAPHCAANLLYLGMYAVRARSKFKRSYRTDLEVSR